MFVTLNPFHHLISVASSIVASFFSPFIASPISSLTPHNMTHVYHVKVWNVPTQYFEANRAAMQRRVALIPYLYTSLRQSFDAGLSLLRCHSS